jgi:hypothetical protein
MADHNTPIGSTSREIESGTVLIGGVVREIESGLVLANGVAKEIAFTKPLVKVVITNNGQIDNYATVTMNGVTYNSEGNFLLYAGTVITLKVRSVNYTGNASIVGRIYVDTVLVQSIKNGTATYELTVDSHTNIHLSRSADGYGTIEVTTQ